MKSDHRPTDLKHRLKTPAGLQLISRSKRKEIEQKRSAAGDSFSDGAKKSPRKSGDSFETMKYTVKNEKASPKKLPVSARVAAAGQ